MLRLKFLGEEGKAVEKMKSKRGWLDALGISNINEYQF